MTDRKLIRALGKLSDYLSGSQDEPADYIQKIHLFTEAGVSPQEFMSLAAYVRQHGVPDPEKGLPDFPPMIAGRELKHTTVDSDGSLTAEYALPDPPPYETEDWTRPGRVPAFRTREPERVLSGPQFESLQKAAQQNLPSAGISLVGRNTGRRERLPFYLTRKPTAEHLTAAPEGSRFHTTAGLFLTRRAVPFALAWVSDNTHSTVSLESLLKDGGKLYTHEKLRLGLTLDPKTLGIGDVVDAFHKDGRAALTGVVIDDTRRAPKWFGARDPRGHYLLSPTLWTFKTPLPKEK